MNFIEAVTAVKEGKCLGIRREDWPRFIQLNGDYLKLEYCGDYFPPSLTPEDIFATDWELVPKPKVKKRIEGWVNLRRNTIRAQKVMIDALFKSEKEALEDREPEVVEYLGDPLHIVHEYEVDQ